MSAAEVCTEVVGVGDHVFFTSEDRRLPERGGNVEGVVVAIDGPTAVIDTADRRVCVGLGCVRIDRRRRLPPGSEWPRRPGQLATATPGRDELAS